MSFYDLTKDFVLSAKDLFKYRGKRNSTLPSKGGQKDFEPDESWMQSKTLEAFMQERTSVLAEPRVEKLKNLVEGKWDDDQGLVSVKKPGKFWAHMGFTDKRRNWLYPEEALFLMESNTLEVYYGGVPLSIQEAYNMFLDSQVSVEEYQVFSHLRRMGFVVLRHENQPIITPYERQINLDKYINKKSRKDQKGRSPKKSKNLKQVVESNETTNLNYNSAKTSTPSLESVVHNLVTANGSNNKIPLFSGSSKDSLVQEQFLSENTTENSHMENEKDTSGFVSLSTSLGKNTEDCAVYCSESNTSTLESKQRKKRPGSPDISSSHESAKRSCLGNEYVACNNSEVKLESVTDLHMSSTLNQDTVLPAAQRLYDNSWSSCFINKIRAQCSVSNNTSGTICQSVTSTCKSDSISQDETQCSNSGIKVLSLPNIANTEMVVLELPNLHLLPENVSIEENSELLKYDVQKYHIMNPAREVRKQVQREEEREMRIEGLQFSFPEWTQRTVKLAAASWKDYKQKLSERMADITESTPVGHLWKGRVTPLLHPGKSWSHQSILDQLSIIQSADNEILLPDSDCVVDVKVAYDVHLPDGRFKKSMPGVPDHRVCISKCSSDLPGLAELHQVWSRFKDNVPLHWAVVDSGEIAFYVFDSTRLIKVID